MKIKDVLDIDYFLLLPVMVIMAIGILFIYSSGITSAGEIVSTEYIRQIVWASAGLIIVFALSMINYRRFYNISLYLYLFTLILLVYIAVFGAVGARWIRIGTFGLQISEFTKVTTILLLARFLASTERSSQPFLRFILSCVIVIIPMGIVLIQPDLGTALVFIPILLSMVLIAGVSLRYVLFAVCCIVLTSLFLFLPLWQTFILQRSIPVIALLTDIRLILIAILAFSVIALIALFGYLKYKKKSFFWILYVVAIVALSLGISYAARGILRHYQIMRLIVFMDPQIDPRGAGWNIIQSVIAIGAGGLTGQGFLQGTQSYYRFLPEQSTDFIFSIFSEETGFLGGIILFALYLIIFLRILRLIKITADPFAVNICAGLVGVYGFHFLINVGMTMGIMPITGIPLLFMSYGGSALFSAMIGIGLIMSIHVRRYNRGP